MSDTASSVDTKSEISSAMLGSTEVDRLSKQNRSLEIDEQQTGLRRVVSAGLVSYDRLPVLEIVFDRLVRILSTSLRSLTSDNVEVSLDSITSIRFGDYAGSALSPTLLSVFSAEQWDNFGLMVLDAPLIYSMIDVLLGGRQGSIPRPAEGRLFTTIERTLVENIVKHILRDLSTSFDPICQVTFRYERTEVNPRLAIISRAASAVVLARLRIEMEDRGGALEIILPYATLEPIRHLLLQQFMGERLGRDSLWETHLADELREAAVELDAVLGEQVMNLSQVLALQVGSRIDFPLASDDPVELRCGDIPLFLARAGNRRNKVAVQIEEKLPSSHVTPGATTA